MTYGVNVRVSDFLQISKNCEFRGATIFFTSLRFVFKEKYLRSHKAAAACAKTLKVEKSCNIPQNSS